MHHTTAYQAMTCRSSGDAGHLPASGPQAVFADAAEVAARLGPDRPLFCFAPAVLANTVETFIASFPGDVSYAVKANPDERVIAIMAEAGLTLFDVASTAEMALVRRLVPGAHLNYHNPIKSDAEIASAYRDFGVRRFSVDHGRELAKVARIAAGDRDVEIAVRFRLATNQGALQDFSSKFGAPPEEAQVLLAEAAALGFRPVLTFHPGSQCINPEAYGEHIAVAAEIARGADVEIATLNVGGGFPAGYTAMAVPPLTAYCATIADMVAEAFGGQAPHLECEPGRALVADAVSLLARVKLVKPDTREVYLNDGVYGALMEFSQCPRLLPPMRVLGHDGSTRAGAMCGFTVYGPTCDPIDRLPGLIELPEDICENDHVEFGLIGAYGAASATRFNGYGDIATVTVERTLTAAG